MPECMKNKNIVTLPFVFRAERERNCFNYNNIIIRNTPELLFTIMHRIGAIRK